MVSPPRAAAGARDWHLWALLGLFALLLGLRLATPYLDADQAVTGLMGSRILDGEFPIFYWRQEHAGVPEAYGAALIFYLFGMSRLTLGLVPALAAVGLVAVLYRTGAVLFGHRTGLLAILFATVVSPYVGGHYVLARAYYVEQLLLGQIVLLAAALWLRHPVGEETRTRLLVAMGLASGLGLYCGFQIVYAAVPAAFALWLGDAGFVRRRGFWLGLGAFLLGSLPFWLYNLTHGWATIATGARFEGELSTAQAARLIARELLPVVLGMTDEALRPYLRWPVGIVIPALVMSAVALLAVRVARGVGRLRREPALAGEALLLLGISAALAAVLFGRFVRVPRYLLPLAPLLALVLARACQLVWRTARPLAAALAAVYLAALGVGLARDLPVLWPETRADYWRRRAEDERLFRFLRERGLTRVYALDYWLAPRLTFDAGEAIVVALPFGDRYPPYTRAVDTSPRPAFVFRHDASRVANWIRTIGSSARREEVGHFTVLWDFPAPPPVVPIARSDWRVSTGPGRGEPKATFDARLATVWGSAGGPPGSAWVDIDLGQRRTVAGVTIVTDGIDHLPATVEVTVATDSGAPRAAARIETFGLVVAWRDGAPRVALGPALTLRFPPIETRRLRLTDLGPGGTWTVAEVFVLGPADRSESVARGIETGRRLEASGSLEAALSRYREAMRAAPDDPDGYAEFTRLAAALGAYAGPLAERAALYARLGFPDEARELYARLAAALGPEVVDVELMERRVRVAAAAGDTAEGGRLRREQEAVLGPVRPVNVRFGSVVELRGYRLEPLRTAPGDVVEVSCYWRSLAAFTGPVVAQLQFSSEHYRFKSELNLPAPIDGLGRRQHLAERRRVVIPVDAPPGRYHVRLAVWDATHERRLRPWRALVVPGPGFTIELGVLDVAPRA